VRLETLIGVRFLVAFEGRQAPREVLELIAGRRTSGVILYRGRNIASPVQLRRLTATLQAAVPAGDPPLLVGVDQEGGQLEALGEGATAWPGNLALAAAASTRLARAVGRAIGLELAAMGVNVVFAPACDLLSPSAATVLGTRTLGDHPARVGALAAAMVRGIQSTGVAATVKHVPGHGAAVGPDPHVALPHAPAPASVLADHLAAFAEPVRAGARLAMLSHLVVPALGLDHATPASLDPLVVGALRDELDFRGVTITDALDMGALGPHEALPDNVVAAVHAGEDLLLTVHSFDLVQAAQERLGAEARDGRLGEASLRSSAQRILRLRRAAARMAAPPLGIVGAPEHAALAREVAARAVALLCDPRRLLPLSHPGVPVVVLQPRPRNLTPAETSQASSGSLAAALSQRGIPVTALELPFEPTPEETAQLLVPIRAAQLAIIGTLEAATHPAQARLVELAARHTPTIAVALRTPYDLEVYPPSVTAAATFGPQRPNIDALVDALTGRIRFRGQLPVLVGGPG